MELFADLPKSPERPLKFDSRSEAIIATLFERFIPNWKAQADITCQIQIGTKRIDFAVENCLIEFHPIFIKRDLKSWQASEKFSKLYRKLHGHDRDVLCEMLTEELEAQYHHRRRQLIESSATYKDKELITCFNNWDVYKHVLKRFSPNPPKWDKFKEMWKEINNNLQ